jgi:hypothetical protein
MSEQQKRTESVRTTPAVAAAVLLAVAAGAALADGPATRPRRQPIKVVNRVAEGGPERRRGGAARGTAADEDLFVVLLAPRVRGNAVTTLEQPTLFWSLSKRVTYPVQVTVNRLEAGRERTVFNKVLAGPHEPGVRKLDLAREADSKGRAVRLEPGVPYEVTVAVLVRADEASANPEAVAVVERVAAAGPPAAGRDAADPYERARAAAAGGAWLDALAALAAAVEASPGDAELRDARAALLKEQGITEGPDGCVVVDAGKPAPAAARQKP